MKLNMRHFIVLFKKDFKNCFVNKNVLIMIALPLIFCGLFTFIFNSQDTGKFGEMMTVMFSIVLVLSVIPLNILSQIVAEEKEKHTLRSLFLANVSAPEFLLSKVAITLVMVFIDGIAAFFICHQDILFIGYYMLFLILGAFGVLFFGAIVGLVSRDQMNAGTIATPLMMLLMLPPMFSELNSFFKTVGIMFPTTAVKTLYLNVVGGPRRLMDKEHIADMLFVRKIRH